jgi:hypothetical protein
MYLHTQGYMQAREEAERDRAAKEEARKRKTVVGTIFGAPEGAASSEARTAEPAIYLETLNEWLTTEVGVAYEEKFGGTMMFRGGLFLPCHNHPHHPS